MQHCLMMCTAAAKAREVVKKPMSFLRIDRAETQFPEDVDMYSDAVDQKARGLLWGVIRAGRARNAGAEGLLLHL